MSGTCLARSLWVARGFPRMEMKIRRCRGIVRELELMQRGERVKEVRRRIKVLEVLRSGILRGGDWNREAGVTATEETVKARVNSVFIVYVIYSVGIIGSVWIHQGDFLRVP